MNNQPDACRLVMNYCYDFIVYMYKELFPLDCNYLVTWTVDIQTWNFINGYTCTVCNLRASSPYPLTPLQCTLLIMSLFEVCSGNLISYRWNTTTTQINCFSQWTGLYRHVPVFDLVSAPSRFWRYNFTLLDLNADWHCAHCVGF